MNNDNGSAVLRLAVDPDDRVAVPEADRAAGLRLELRNDLRRGLEHWGAGQSGGAG